MLNNNNNNNIFECDVLIVYLLFFYFILEILRTVFFLYKILGCIYIKKMKLIKMFENYKLFYYKIVVVLFF